MAAHNFDNNMQQGMQNVPPQNSLRWEGMWHDSGVQSGASTRGEPSVRSVKTEWQSQPQSQQVQAQVQPQLQPQPQPQPQPGAYPSQAAAYGPLSVNSNFEQQPTHSRDDQFRMCILGEDSNRMGQPGAMQMGGELNVVQMAEPGQQVTDSVANLITLQDDADIAQQAIPELMRLLEDSDGVVVNRSAMMVHQLSKKEASRHAIMNSQPMMTTIVQVLNMTGDNEAQRYLAGTLHNVSHHRQGLIGIFRSGGVPVLVRLLRSSLEPVLFFAITTLHNLLLHQDGAKKAVREAGGIPEMVRLLGHSNVKFLAITTDCLQTLSYGNQESKLALLSNGAPRELVRIMANCNYEKLLWTTCRLLKVLSVCPSNKPVLVECGAVQALGQQLSSQSNRLVLNCLWTIRNLSDAATRLEGIDGVLSTLVNLLFQSLQMLPSQTPGSFAQPQGSAVDHAQVVSCVCGILSNLTCNNVRNKQVLTRNGGLQLLVRVLVVCAQLGTDRDDILEPAVCTLRHLTAKHAEAEVAHNMVRDENGIPVLIHFLGTPSTSAPAAGSANAGAGASLKWPVQKALASLIRNLSLSPSNGAALRECGAIRKLLDLMNVAQQLIRSRQAASQSNLAAPATGSTLIDGVRLEEVLEHTCGALHILARDPANRSAIAALNCVPLFVHLLYVPTDAVQRAACGVLFELAADRDQAVLIDQVGGEAPLTELLHSRNEMVQQFAASVLMRLANYKPPEYQARLHIELRNSVGARPLNTNNGQSQFGGYNAPQSQYVTSQSNQFGFGTQQNPMMTGSQYAMSNQVGMNQMAMNQPTYQSGSPPGYSTLPPGGPPAFGSANQSQVSANTLPSSSQLVNDNLGLIDVMLAANDQMYLNCIDQPLALSNVEYLTNQVGGMQPYGYSGPGSGVRTPASGAMTPLTPPTGTMTPAEYFHSNL